MTSSRSDEPSPEEAAVLEYLDEHADDHVSLLRELIRAKPVNPPGNEERAAAVIRPILDELGFEVEEYTEVEGRPNLVARLPGSGDGPTLLMNAHLDVVPVREPEKWPCDPFAAEIIDGKLYGRGAVDHKPPIVAMLGAVEALQARDVRLDGDLLFVFDSNEEQGGEHGMKYVVENADIEADMGIYACTTSLTPEAVEYFPNQGPDNVHRANFGNQVFRVTVEGHLEHPLGAAETDSAGSRLARLLPHIEAYCEDVKGREDDLLGRLDAELTTVESEGRPGRASREVRVHVRRYYAPSEDADDVFGEFVGRVESAAATEGIEDAVSVERLSDMPNVEVPESHEMVEATRRSARLVRGREPTVTGVPAQTGITWLVREWGIPMILFGFGNVNLHHAEPEWIDPSDVTDTAKAYALTYLSLLTDGE
ncbi:M20 family metallopeptidase [Halobaculum sp. EA56]|uniref:M20 family metallopeptidase n=1 Tax=Halobaculum sp. EA56 TaxID=3421648 RepID=UPI003EC07F47